MKDTKLIRILNLICRWFVGLVFIFSGFVKGVDPMGTSFKITEYMTAWQIGGLTFEWATPMATFLSVALVTMEFTVGVLLITGSFRRLNSGILALMMLFFTVTTLYDALTNKVTDCGCFGDAIKLTNWQTFFKNVVLDVPTVFIFLTRKVHYKKMLERDTTISLFAILVMVIFALYNINNEPVIDFRAWKVGNQMIPSNEEGLEVQSFVTYQNKTTGETIEFPSSKLVDYYKDSNWVNEWEWKDSRVVDPYEIQAAGFSMLGPDEMDYATEIVGSEDYVLIATIHHLNKVDAKEVNAFKMVHQMAEEKGLYFVLLVSALPEEVEQFLYDNQLDDMEYYFADATAIETMLRSNPGFILLKDAVVKGKWHYRNAIKIADYPFELNN